MDVTAELIVGARVAIEFAPRGSAVMCQQKRTLLDRHIERVWIPRIKHHHFGVCQMRRGGKGPALCAGHLAHGRPFGPAPPEIAASEQRCRLRSRINGYAVLLLDRRERIHVFRAHAVVALLPVIATVSAEKYAV